jgi:hypothetical protein
MKKKYFNNFFRQQRYFSFILFYFIFIFFAQLFTISINYDSRWASATAPLFSTFSLFKFVLIFLILPSRCSLLNCWKNRKMRNERKIKLFNHLNEILRKKNSSFFLFLQLNTEQRSKIKHKLEEFYLTFRDWGSSSVLLYIKRIF